MHEKDLAAAIVALANAMSEFHLATVAIGAGNIERAKEVQKDAFAHVNRAISIAEAVMRGEEPPDGGPYR